MQSYVYPRRSNCAVANEHQHVPRVQYAGSSRPAWRTRVALWQCHASCLRLCSLLPAQSGVTSVVILLHVLPLLVLLVRVLAVQDRHVC